MENLFTPWRHPYITSPRSRDQSCFFCTAAQDRDDPERLVVHWTAHHQVLLNRHPYTTGHLMVAPLGHHSSPLACDPEARAEFWPLVLRCQEVLGAAFEPDGFNLGMNLGRASGAGVPGHFHFHLVCRWKGDTNFMGVVAGVRLIPEELRDTWQRLRRVFDHPTAVEG
jgi:ATP adenylyltransferase